MIGPPTLADPFGFPALMVVALALFILAAFAFLLEVALPRFPVRQRYDRVGWILAACGFAAAGIHLLTL